MAVLEAAFRTREAQTVLLEYCLQASMFDQTFASVPFKDEERVRILLSAGSLSSSRCRNELILLAARLGKPYMSTKLFEAATESQSVLDEDILTTVARNETDGAAIMEGIEKLSRISDKMIITERVVTAAAQNKSGGHAIVNMLHRCHESDGESFLDNAR